MERLIRMTEFVLKYTNTHLMTKQEFHTIVRIYAKFLSQKLELWMFVPCKLVEGVWVLLEDPEKENYLLPKEHQNNKGNIVDLVKFTKSFDDYQEAKDRVLFEGFEFKQNGFYCSENQVIQQYEQTKFSIFNILGENSYTVFVNTIEDLTKHNLKLTASAKKTLSI